MTEAVDMMEWICVKTGYSFGFECLMRTEESKDDSKSSKAELPD